MKNVMGIISLVKNDALIREFTERRPIASIPIAGRYRIIDFVLSNMVNSGIDSVGVMLPPKSRSLLDHLRSGKDWDLARRSNGLIYLPPADDEQLRPGNLKGCYDNLDFVEQNPEHYVLLAEADAVYNMDFSAVRDFYQNTGADIVAVYAIARKNDSGEGVVIRTAPDGTVIDMAVRSSVHKAEKMALGIYLMKKRIYAELVRYAYERGGADFLQDAVMRSANDYMIYGFEHKGYVARINSTMAYYHANMDMLDPTIWRELFMGERQIYTKLMDRAPVEYKETAEVSDSLAANGCIIRGKVEHSILFRGVIIGEGALVRNSIVMQNSVIEPGATVENAMLDKNVTVTTDKHLSGAPNYPMIIGKGITI